jgi:hypothetical protein
MSPPDRNAHDDPGRPGESARDHQSAGPPRRGGPRRRPRNRSQHQHRGSSAGPIRLARIAGNDFELLHPRQVMEVDLDYQEGLEIWKAGDPEAARDALRYALGACHDNLWVHVALGQIALRDFRDPTLARGHFGYTVELAERALPRGFTGRLPRERPNNRPFYEAVEGLLQCLEALGMAKDAGKLRALRDRLSNGCDHGDPP